MSIKSCQTCTHRFEDAGIQGSACSRCNMAYINWVQVDVPKPSDTDSTYVKKADFGKVDMSLLEYFPLALEAVCKPSEFGCTKYERGSFADVPNARRRYTAAMFRHFFKEGVENTPNIDKESGIEHDAMVAWNALTRLELRLRGYKLTESNK